MCYFIFISWFVWKTLSTIMLRCDVTREEINWWLRKGIKTLVGGFMKIVVCDTDNHQGNRYGDYQEACPCNATQLNDRASRQSLESRQVAWLDAWPRLGAMWHILVMWHPESWVSIWHCAMAQAKCGNNSFLFLNQILRDNIQCKHLIMPIDDWQSCTNIPRYQRSMTIRSSNISYG